MKAEEGFYKEEQAQRAAYLIAGYLRQELTEKEKDELDDWITASDANQDLFEELIEQQHIDEGMQEMGGFDTEAALARIEQRMTFTKRPKRNGRLLIYMMQAAAVLVLVAGAYLFYQQGKHAPKEEQGTVEGNAIQPGGNYALLTLDNGKQIRVEEMQSGVTASFEGIDVRKTTDGELEYEANSQAANVTHQLRTATGGQYRLVLADGSKVWLNAASSLTYPVSFGKGERVVELTGEGYFEIATVYEKDEKGRSRKQPFTVKVNGVRVEVMGTHFNVNAYGDEAVVKTMLVEGRVRVVRREPVADSGELVVGRRKPGAGSRELEVVLEPGEEAVLTKEGKLTVSKVDTEMATGWKDGWFVFKDASIEEIFMQLKRWYAIDVVYKGTIRKHFQAEIKRNEPIEKLLKLLEQTGSVHFKTENKTVYVLP